jgi:hypothetical protein
MLGAIDVGVSLQGVGVNQLFGGEVRAVSVFSRFLPCDAGI